MNEKTVGSKGWCRSRKPFFGRRLGARRPARILFAAAAVFSFALGAGASAATLEEVANFGSNPGNLRMFKYVPDELEPGSPLVVVLHGCGQDAETYATNTGWQKLADDLGFALLAPQEEMRNNVAKCFNWFVKNDIQRDRGEAHSIKQMVDKMKADHHVDGSRIYVTGLSAGGAMTAVMLATYPELFASGAVIAGIPYDCARPIFIGMTDATDCMKAKKDLSPTTWGNRVRNATSHTGPWPTVSIWQGEADTTVESESLRELVDQWTNVHGVDQQPDLVDQIDGQPYKVHHNIYTDSAGNAVVESYLIEGMTHGTPIDPGHDDTQCGTAVPYILDADICSTHHIARFWGLDKPTQKPFPITIVTPAEDDTVKGLVTIQTEIGESIQVKQVEFYIDDLLRKSGSATRWDWDAGQEEDGRHYIQVRAVDAQENPGRSKSIAVTVIEGIPVDTGLQETFSHASNLFDNKGWEESDWEASSENHGAAGSRSVFAQVSSGVGGEMGLKSKSLAIKVDLDDDPMLNYFRKLDLNSMGNILTTAAFRVRVNGTVVDEESVKFGKHAEPNWTTRSNIDLSAFANQEVSLAFEVSADSNLPMEIYAKAWIDDIEVK